MHDNNPDEGRKDPRLAVERAGKRLAKREKSGLGYWRSIRILGMVGWPIALGAVGGTLLGRWFDIRWNAGIRWTLVFMMIGVSAGCWSAWVTLAPHKED